MGLSPLAQLVLQHHRARPDEPMYDLGVFGNRREVASSLEASDVDRLDAAYRELEAAGHVEKTEEAAGFRKQFFYLYRLKSPANVPAESSR